MVKSIWSIGLFAALVTVAAMSRADAQSCDPVTGTCSLRESAIRVATSPIRVVAHAAPAVASIAMAPVAAASNAYQEALASAQYRAANRIHGHSSLDTHRTSGVGWASSDSNPTTCLGRGGDNYAVVRGSDGWYATKFSESSSVSSTSSVSSYSHKTTVRATRSVRLFRR